MVTLNRETERKKMSSVFIIEEQVDYEGDTVVSIHATRPGALRVLIANMLELQSGDRRL